MMNNKCKHPCHWEVFSVLCPNYKQQKTYKAPLSELRKEPDEMDAKNGKKELKTLQNELHQEISSQYTNTTIVHNTAQKKSIPKN